MNTFDEANAVVRSHSETPDFDTLLRTVESMTGALKAQKVQLMTDSEKQKTEMEKAVELQIAKVTSTLEFFEKFCAEKLPKIIKQNVEANYFEQSKEMATDIGNHMRQALNDAFKDFGKTLSAYEAQAQRATELVKTRSERPLHLAMFHGTKWLIISLAFTFTILKVQSHFDQKDITYARHARTAIKSLSPANQQTLNYMIDNSKE